MTKRDFIQRLIEKLDDADELDKHNYYNTSDQIKEIYDIMADYVEDYTIVQGFIVD